MWAALIVFWFYGGMLTGVFGSESEIVKCLPTRDARIVASVVAAALWPIVGACGVLYAIGLGGTVFGRGSRDLYRLARPKCRRELPEARVVERDR